MKTLSLFLIIAITLAGCTNRFIIESTSKTDVEKINKLSKEYNSTLELLSGRIKNVTNIMITPDSTTWTDSRSRINHKAETDEIISVNIIKRWKGAWQGLGIGFLSGAVGGVFIGFADGDDPPGWFSMKASEKAFVGGIGLGVLGGLLGFPIGATIGSEAVYFVSHNN